MKCTNSESGLNKRLRLTGTMLSRKCVWKNDEIWILVTGSRQRLGTVKWLRRSTCFEIDGTHQFLCMLEQVSDELYKVTWDWKIDDTQTRSLFEGCAKTRREERNDAYIRIAWFEPGGLNSKQFTRHTRNDEEAGFQQTYQCLLNLCE
jgi:hypothetical protein